MKTKLIICLCVTALVVASTSSANASTEDPGAAAIADVLIARPACLAATVIGSVFFVVALPFALASRTVDKTADSLVVKPAKATFTRPLGDFEALRE
jgi:hypothetical protein